MTKQSFFCSFPVSIEKCNELENSDLMTSWMHCDQSHRLRLSYFGTVCEQNDMTKPLRIIRQKQGLLGNSTDLI